MQAGSPQTDLKMTWELENAPSLGSKFLLWLGGWSWVKVPTQRKGIMWFEPPSGDKGGSARVFFFCFFFKSACPDTGQKGKRKDKALKLSVVGHQKNAAGLFNQWDCPLFPCPNFCMVDVHLAYSKRESHFTVYLSIIYARLYCWDSKAVIIKTTVEKKHWVRWNFWTEVMLKTLILWEGREIWNSLGLMFEIHKINLLKCKNNH